MKSEYIFFPLISLIIPTSWRQVPTSTPVEIAQIQTDTDVVLDALKSTNFNKKKAGALLNLDSKAMNKKINEIRNQELN